MKLAIVTLAINVPELIKWSMPLFSKYAEKIGASVVTIDTPKIKHPFSPMLEKYQMYDLLGVYDRIIFFDADIIIQPSMPNLFEIVNPDAVGAVYDIDTNDEHNTNRNGSIDNMLKVLGNINWKKGYVNSGVMVLSRDHRDIYIYDRRLHKVPHKRFVEQTSVNYNIKKNGFKIQKLDRSFNRIAFGGKDEQYYEKGNLAYVVHLAGRGNKPALMEKFYNIVMKMEK